MDRWTHLKRPIGDRGYSVVRHVEPREVGLVLESTGLQRVQKVSRQVQLFQLGVEVEALVDGGAADSVAPQDEPPQLRVEGDRDDVQVSADALHAKRHVVAHATRGAYREDVVTPGHNEHWQNEHAVC